MKASGMAEREYEVGFTVTLHVTDRGLRPVADLVRHTLLEAAPAFASHPGVDLIDVTVEEDE